MLKFTPSNNSISLNMKLILESLTCQNIPHTQFLLRWVILLNPLEDVTLCIHSLQRSISLKWIWQISEDLVSLLTKTAPHKLSLVIRFQLMVVMILLDFMNFDWLSKIFKRAHTDFQRLQCFLLDLHWFFVILLDFRWFSLILINVHWFS